MNEALLPSAELPAAQPPSELPEHIAAVQPNWPAATAAQPTAVCGCCYRLAHTVAQPRLAH